MEEPGLWRGGVWRLYISRALTAWGDRLWAFGLGLLLFKIFPDNLTLVAAFGLTNCVVSITLGAHIGNWIDSSNRLKAAKLFLIVQNTFVALDCCLFAVYFYWQEKIVAFGGVGIKVAVAVAASFLALVSHLASSGSKIVVEKDWIVVIAGGDDDRLAKLNSIFRTIDLICLNLSPALAGLLFSYTSYSFTALIILIWNVLSVVLEYYLLVSIYDQFGNLAKKQTVKEKSSFKSDVMGSVEGWKFFFHHSVRNASLGLALLFMTVLGFDATTWAFALLQCVPESVLGLLVAVSAVVGILGSLAFPALRRALNTETAGMTGMACLVAALSLCVVSVWLPGSPFILYGGATDRNVTVNLTDNSTSQGSARCSQTEPNMTSVSVLLSGIILARFGLWISDLSVTQIVQENVEENKRGVIGGIQNSLNSFLNMIKFCLVLIMPEQEMFGFLVILSFVFICLGALSLTSYAFKEKKILCPCCPSSKYSVTNTQDPDGSEERA